jgi:arginyl-tRNA synthetase
VVSIGAVKYAFLKSNIYQNSAFDLEESISFDGNSGPYLQYTYARIMSVLKAKLEKEEQGELNFSNAEEWTLVKHISKFPEIVTAAAENYAPHLIANYLFELAQKFNTFYKQHSINSADKPAEIYSRRILAEKTATVLKSGLSLLGIETVEKM